MSNKQLVVDRKEKSQKRFLIIFFVLLLLPGRGVFYYIRPLFCILYWFFSSLKFKSGFTIKSKYLLFFLIWFACLMLGQVVIVGETHTDTLLHEFLRVALYFVIMLPLQNIKINKKHLTVLSVAFILTNLIIQVCEFFKVEAVFTFIQKNYITSNDLRHLNLARNDTLASFRSGSVYINPNVYTPLALLCVAVILFALEDSIVNKKNSNTLSLSAFLALSAISLLLTGSRTAFVGLAVMIVVFSCKVLKKKPFFILLIVIAFAVAFVFLSKSESRFISVSSGMDDSFGHKIEQLFNYISTVNPISFICGNNSNIGSTEWGYDFEWGYVFVYTGLIGLFDYLFIHNTFYKKYKKDSCGRLYLYVLLAFLVQSLSATVLYNSFAYPLLALFVFSDGVE